MRLERIPGANLILNPPPGWDSDSDDGVELVGFPVIRTSQGFLSQWRPSPEEIAALFAGAPLILCVVGDVQPPVSMTTGGVPSLAEMKAGAKEQ